jgi:adenylate cyclase
VINQKANKMKKSILLTGLLYHASIIFCIAQQPNLDSLYSVWQDENQPDSTRVSAYNDYIWDGFLFSQPDTAEVLAEALHAYAKEHQCPKASAVGYNLQGIANTILGNYSSALSYHQKELEINEKLGNKKAILKSLNSIGILYQEQGNYIHALESFEKSLKMSEEFGDDQDVAASFNNMGNIYGTIGNFPLSLEYHQKSLTIREKIFQTEGPQGDKSGIAASLTNIGSIYYGQGNYPSALEYFQKTLAIDEEIGNKEYISGTLGNIGIIYADQGNFTGALKYLKKALVLKEEIGHRMGIARSLSGIGLVYYNQDSTSKALEYYHEALKIELEIENKNGIANSLVVIGSLYQKQRAYSYALDYCHKGLALAEEIGVLDWQQAACECLYNTYLDLGKDKEALKYFGQMIEVRDSLFNEENTKKLTRLEMQYDFDKKEAETKAEQEKKDAIALQEVKRQKLIRNGFMGGFGVVLLFAGVFFRQRNRIGKEKKRSEELLLNILPEEVAEELKAKGSADAVQIDRVTVLFTDFKGFTAISELVSPKELVADLHECFSAFDSICEKYGIEKIKTIGDAYMAAGGLPSPNTTHAKDVVKAGLEMAEVVEKGKAAKIAAGLPFFEVRIGIHTGPVVAGIVGVKKFQYDIWGDTVNTASRMESSGAVGKVNISEATYDLLKNEPGFAFESRGKIEAKGKGEVEMWFVSEKLKAKS